MYTLCMLHNQCLSCGMQRAFLSKAQAFGPLRLRYARFCIGFIEHFYLRLLEDSDVWS